MLVFALPPVIGYGLDLRYMIAFCERKFITLSRFITV